MNIIKNDFQDYPAFVSDLIEVRVGKFGPGLFAKKGIPSETVLVKERDSVYYF